MATSFELFCIRSFHIIVFFDLSLWCTSWFTILFRVFIGCSFTLINTFFSCPISSSNNVVLEPIIFSCLTKFHIILNFHSSGGRTFQLIYRSVFLKWTPVCFFWPFFELFTSTSKVVTCLSYANSNRNWIFV